MNRPARAPRWRQAGRRAGILLGAAALLSGCSDASLRDPAAERGRQIYLAQCIACHNPDPARPGAVGPEVRGSSRELLEEKVVRGVYPPGYKAKRDTKVMPPQPGLAPDIGDLAAFLK